MEDSYNMNLPEIYYLSPVWFKQSAGNPPFIFIPRNLPTALGNYVLSERLDSRHATDSSLAYQTSRNFRVSRLR